jgi:transcriptional regulator with XRE-family HTH domain
MMPTMATTGAKLKRIRRGSGMTQAELYEASGVAASTIARIENGQRKMPHPRTLKKLAEALNVSIYDLLEDE